MATPTMIYLTTKQRKGYFSRARRHRTSFSEEVRKALDFYLEFPLDFDQEELGRLAEEANASLDRSIARLDGAILSMAKVAKALERSDRRLHELDRKHLRRA